MQTKFENILIDKDNLEKKNLPIQIPIRESKSIRQPNTFWYQF